MFLISVGGVLSSDMIGWAHGPLSHLPHIGLTLANDPVSQVLPQYLYQS